MGAIHEAHGARHRACRVTVDPLAPTHAEGTEGPDTTEAPVAQYGAPISDFKGFTVVHWAPGYASEPLDASVAKYRDPKNVVPETVIKAAKQSKASPSAAAGFVCSLYVGTTTRPSSTQLKAVTGQTCTGSFSEQFTTVGFQRKTWLQYWTTYGLTKESRHTSSQTLDVTWYIGCSNSGLNYNYRLQARAWARSSGDGNLVYGPLTNGAQSNPYPCGT